MTTTQKGFIALIAILILGGGAYAYVQNTQTPPLATTQTSDLKTYTNTEYSFSFKYPTSFGVPKEYIHTSAEKLKNNPDSVVFLDGRLVISSGVSYNATTGQPMTFAEATAGGSNKKQIIVDGRDGIQVSSPQLGTVTMVPLSGNAFVTIEGSPDLQNQILPTFKFSPNSQTADWKIYTNTSKGYSISYPIDAKIDTSDLSCVRINTKEFGSISIDAGSSNPCGDPTGLGVGMIRSEDTIAIASKQYPTSGYRESDNSFSFFDLNSPISEKISVTYGVDHSDKSNPNNWKNLGALTDSEYQNALNSAKEIVSTLKIN